MILVTFNTRFLNMKNVTNNDVHYGRTADRTKTMCNVDAYNSTEMQTRSASNIQLSATQLSELRRVGTADYPTWA